jgi:RNA polymerase sigma-70 factor (ECF subfamily)
MTISPSLPNEDELVQSAQHGALDAFTTLYEHYFPIVYKRVCYIVPVDDVEDVTQEIFIAVMRSLKSFRGEARFGTWLRTITSRQIAGYYRSKHKPEVPLTENIHATHDAGISDEAITLKQALRKIPQNYREILLLRFAENMPFHEIARLQGRNLESTKSFFRRAVAALQKQVNKHE